MDNITRRNFFSRSLAIGAGLSSLPLISPSKLNSAVRPTKDDISLWNGR